LLKLLRLRLSFPIVARGLMMARISTNLTFEERTAGRQKMEWCQGAALFDSLTVFENVGLSVREHTKMDEDEIKEASQGEATVVRLDRPDRSDRNQLQEELYGGPMRKRCRGIARGMENNADIMLIR